MRFTVEEPDARAEMIVRGPQEICTHGHEDCSFTRGGSCTQLECTCETYGSCAACGR